MAKHKWIVFMPLPIHSVYVSRCSQCLIRLPKCLEKKKSSRVEKYFSISRIEFVSISACTHVQMRRKKYKRNIKIACKFNWARGGWNDAFLIHKKKKFSFFYFFTALLPIANILSNSVRVHITSDVVSPLPAQKNRLHARRPLEAYGFLLMAVMLVVVVGTTEVAHDSVVNKGGEIKANVEENQSQRAWCYVTYI